MALITSAVRDKIGVLVEDLRYFTFNTKYKHKTGASMDDDDVIATEEDARATIIRINKAVVALNKVSDKIIVKFRLV